MAFKMRLETSKKPSSWWLLLGHLVQLQDGPDNTHLQGSASSIRHWQKTALHFAHCQDTIHNVARMDTGRMTAPLCLCKVDQSPTPTVTE
jgi:hypothetical protein